MADGTRFVELNGIELAYSDRGVGSVVLDAHGLTSSRAVQAQLGLSDFTPVSERARLISYDARGHGESSGHANPEEYTWARLAHDMLALADHVSGPAPVSAIGLSMGTGTLLHAALERPERFECLVLSAPPTAWETRVGQVRIYQQLAETVESSTPEAVATFFKSALTAPIFRDVAGYPPLPDVTQALLPSLFRGAALSDLPEPQRLRSLHHPALILAWAGDAGHPVSSAEKLAALLPDARLHVSTTSQDIRTWGARAAQFLAA